MGGPALRVEVASAKSLPAPASRLQLHVLFSKHARRSPIYSTFPSSSSSSYEHSSPVFNYSVSFPLSSALSSALTSSALVHLEEPVLVYLTVPEQLQQRDDDDDDVGEKRNDNVEELSKEQYDDGGGSLVAAAVLDFRYCLLHKEDFVSVELLPCELEGGMMGMPGGVLFARLSLQNVPEEVTELNQGDLHAVEDAIANYQHKLSKENRDLYLTVKSWWANVIKLYPHVSGRVIKVLTEDEIGCHRSVCSLISPIPPPREMTSPRHAARFVSLIPFKRDAGLTGGRVETWRSSHAILCRKQGDVEDHTLLLCSLLLGWGLDAWVALGTIQTPSSDGKGVSQRPYCWVVTFDYPPAVEGTTFDEPIVTFWEALGGRQYQLPHPSDDKSAEALKKQKHSFCELHCLFRHDCFMLNVQLSCAVSNATQIIRPDVAPEPIMSFDINNEKKFALFPPHAISPLLRHPGCGMHLTYEPRVHQSTYISAIEMRIEKALRDEIANKRYAKNLYTNFDEKLSLILQPVLASYELDRVMGVTFGNSDFQCAIRRHVKHGECFKAFPTCFSSTNAALMLAKLSRSEAAMDVIMTSGRGCRHGLRVRLEAYPEGVFAVWLMIAVCSEKTTNVK